MSPRRDYLASAKDRLKGILNDEQRRTWRRQLAEPAGLIFRRDLRRLAVIYGSDKWNSHWYAQHYQHHFYPSRRKKITLLEIGIGGNDDPQGGGGSLRMWRRFFPFATIVGLDLYDKSAHAEPRIRVFQGDQEDERFLRRVIDDIGPPDIIIDDGSHINRHVTRTFEVLFPMLADDGIYAIEDTQTSYWREYGGSSEDLISAPTTMARMKGLADGLNYEELTLPGYVPSYFDQNVCALHFYHNLVFIQKGPNREGSSRRQAPQSVPVEP